eukprot:TRINITY_DN6087_c0_g1_i1.p1 TRINITY_DN6087_c0_g1~~TRINITY_DN6087_c0_g1_i1.p1  ORF type:complete len:916 (+),score=214.58 TRINITY_DN6087_c0_g1_i1:4745-7492(+)
MHMFSRQRSLGDKRDSSGSSYSNNNHNNNDDLVDNDEFTSPFITDVDLSGGDARVIPYELRRNTLLADPQHPNGLWELIKVGSLDWRQTEKQYPSSLVVRVSAIVSGGAAASKFEEGDSKVSVSTPEEIVKAFIQGVPDYPSVDNALHIVCMFKEFGVAENSPLRYTANFWFIFPELARVDSSDFEVSISALLPEKCISYVTFEVLTSFLSRREYESKLIASSEARQRLQNHLLNMEPCSSLFLKLSPECPDVCKQLLLQIQPGSAKYLAGVRAIHKLAVSCTSSHMNSQHNYNETLTVMKLGIDPKDWSFVVFKTLTRLATKNDRTRKINPVKTPSKSHVVQMLSLVDQSNLHFVEKLAIRIIAKDYRSPSAPEKEVQELVDFLHAIIVSAEDKISDAQFQRLLTLINDGAPSTCHLTGVLLEKCVEQENFNIGWKIASTVESVNEHTIEEIVTLCSKAFFKFSRSDKDEANRWFDRVFWCVERHYKLLGKYPSGLALHVAAHRGDFDLCWKWFNAKKEEKSFRFTAHHTSSIFKAATYAKDAVAHMDEVLQAYKMTPHKEKSPFVFEPLFHLWGITEKCRDEHWSFWEMVHRDLKQYLDGVSHQSNDENTLRKVRKLSLWLSGMEDWKTGGSSIPPTSSHHRKAVRRTMSTSGIEVTTARPIVSRPSSQFTPSNPGASGPAVRSKPGLNRRRLSDSIPPQAVDILRADAASWRPSVDSEETKESQYVAPSFTPSSRALESPSRLSLFSSPRENVATVGSFGSDLFSPLARENSSPSQDAPGLFSRSFVSYPLVKEDSRAPFIPSATFSGPESVFEGRNPDPVFIPQRKPVSILPASSSIPSPMVKSKFSLSLNFGSDKIWSHAATPSSEKENSAWKSVAGDSPSSSASSTGAAKQSTEPLRFMPLSLRSILDC